MCGCHGQDVIEFAIRAIAAGAAGKGLAAWALEERVRVIKEREKWQDDFDAMMQGELAK